jgi:MGT family glycosyltransferase
MMDFARALAGEGHSVSLFSWPMARELADAAGIDFIPIHENTFQEEKINFREMVYFHLWRALIRLVARGSVASTGGIRGMLIVTRVYRYWTKVFLENADASLLNHHYDIVIAPQQAFAAKIISESLSAELITVFITLPISERNDFFPWAYRDCSDSWGSRSVRLLAKFAMRPIVHLIDARSRSQGGERIHSIDELISSKLKLSQIPPGLLYGHQEIDQSIIHLGPVDKADLQGEQEHNENDYSFSIEKPLVYIAMGTLVWRPQLLMNAAKACHQLGLDCVISLGGLTLDQESLDFPLGTEVQDFAPQEEMLRKASVFITHGGMNSIIESIHHGVPMLVIPHVIDQYGVARLITANQLGLYLPERNASIEALMTQIMSLLNDKKFRNKCHDYSMDPKRMGNGKEGFLVEFKKHFS